MLRKTRIQPITLANLAPISYRSTGLPFLDASLGGGFPKGAVVQIYGWESSGKTTLTLQAIAEAQRQEPTRKVAYFDIDRTLNPQYAIKLGVDPNRFDYYQPDTIEDCWNEVFDLLEGDRPSIIVIDSEAISACQAELEGGMEVYGPIHARAMSMGMNRSLPRLGDTTIIVISQFRAKTEVVYGSPEAITGGNSIRFTASVRLEMRRIQTLKYGVQEFGTVIKIKVAKNKHYNPFVVVDAPLIFGEGFSYPISLAQLGTALDVLTASGHTYYWGTTTYCNPAVSHNEKQAHEYFSQPDVQARLRAAIAEKMNPSSSGLVLQTAEKPKKSRRKKSEGKVEVCV